jgi:hypothetical protein
MSRTHCVGLPLLAVGAEMARPSVFGGLYSYEKVMLVCGVVLFAVLAALLMYSIVTKKSYLPLLSGFVLPIVMIGFPAVQKINFDNEVKDAQALADQVKSAPPGQETAAKLKTELKATLSRIEPGRVTDPRTRSLLERAYTTAGDPEGAKLYKERLLPSKTNVVQPRRDQQP